MWTVCWNHDGHDYWERLENEGAVMEKLRRLREDCYPSLNLQEMCISEVLVLPPTEEYIPEMTH